MGGRERGLSLRLRESLSELERDEREWERERERERGRGLVPFYNDIFSQLLQGLVEGRMGTGTFVIG